MKYKLRPRTVDAFKWEGDMDMLPRWGRRMKTAQNVLYDGTYRTVLIIEGEKDVQVWPGDYAVYEDGIVYTMKAHKFEGLFEPMEES